MSIVGRCTAVVRRWAAAGTGRWRTRGGVVVGEPFARGLGLPVRLALWGLAGVALFAGLKLLIAWALPAVADASGEPPTPWATLYVICTNPACHASATTRQPMDFNAWPLTCDRCGQLTVQRATRCPRCATWIAAAARADCWQCAAKRAASQPKKPPRRPGASPDDDEDGWDP